MASILRYLGLRWPQQGTDASIDHEVTTPGSYHTAPEHRETSPGLRIRTNYLNRDETSCDSSNQRNCPSIQRSAFKLGVRLPDGRKTTGDAVEDWIQLLVEAVDRFDARKVILEERDHITTNWRTSKFKIDRACEELALLQPRLVEIPVLGDRITELKDEKDSHLQEYQDELEKLDRLNRMLLQAEATLHTLMSVLCDTSDVFLNTIDKHGHSRGITINSQFRFSIGFVRRSMQEVHQLEQDCRRASAQWHEATRLCLTARSTFSRPSAAVTYCESASLTLGRRWRRVKDDLERQKTTQWARINSFLNSFARERLINSGRLKVARSYGFTEAARHIHARNEMLSKDSSHTRQQDLHEKACPPARSPSVDNDSSGSLRTLAGLEREPDALYILRELRKHAANVREVLENHKKNYQNELTKSIFLRPWCTQAEVDAAWHQRSGGCPHKAEEHIRAELQQFEGYREDAAQKVREQGYGGLLLSPAWARSYDSDGKHGSCSNSVMEAAYPPDTVLQIDNWIENVERADPTCEDLKVAPATPADVDIQDLGEPSPAWISPSSSPKFPRPLRRRRYKARMRKLRRYGTMQDHV